MKFKIDLTDPFAVHAHCEPCVECSHRPRLETSAVGEQRLRCPICGHVGGWDVPSRPNILVAKWNIANYCPSTESGKIIKDMLSHYLGPYGSLGRRRPSDEKELNL